jgi:hypothetical protein
MAIKKYPRKAVRDRTGVDKKELDRQEVFSELDAAIVAAKEAACYDGNAGADGLLNKARSICRKDERWEPLLDAAKHIKRAVGMLSRVPSQILNDFMLKAIRQAARSAQEELKRLPSDHDTPPLPRPRRTSR